MNNVLKVIGSRWFPYAIIVGVLLLLAHSCSKQRELERQAAIKDQNLIAATDTIRQERTKSGALNASIAGYIAKEKDLKELNRGLFEELDDQKGKVLTLNRTVVRLEQDKATLQKYIDEMGTTADSVEQINDSTYVAPWTLSFRYDSVNYDVFRGRTELFLRGDPFSLNHNRTWLEGRETQIGLTFGQRVEDDQLRVFVQSSYPGFTTKSLEGVLIDPNTNPYLKSLIKKKHWFTGFNVGLGTTIGYDLLNGRPGFVIGPSLNWSIYQW